MICLYEYFLESSLYIGTLGFWSRGTFLGMGKIRRKSTHGWLEAVFGGEMATAKIQTVKGLRVEIFSRSVRENTTRPLTVWIAETDIERNCFS